MRVTCTTVSVLTCSKIINDVQPQFVLHIELNRCKSAEELLQIIKTSPKKPTLEAMKQRGKEIQSTYRLDIQSKNPLRAITVKCSNYL